MINKDDLICTLVNYLTYFSSFLNLKSQRLLKNSKNISEEELYIILNGPSIKKQDLSLLSGKSLLFVNRGFQHPLYETLKPKYHMFIDPKMLNGEWSLDWIDFILNIVPNITFIFPVSWASKKQLKPFIDREISICWLNDSTPATLLGVGGYSIRFGIQNKIKKIFFTGFEATGLAHEMINSQSHFYGVNKENLKKTCSDYVSDLYMFSRHLRDLTKLSLEAKSNNIEVINLTEGGLLDMFPKLKFEHLK
jgi:hypothetical protein